MPLSSPDIHSAGTAGQHWRPTGGREGMALSSRVTPGGPENVTVAERRVCSVLFVDLVSFTPLSERGTPKRSASCCRPTSTGPRTVIGRYGGVVEKFIGDAVMAVWGTPVPTKATPSGPCAPP